MVFSRTEKYPGKPFSYVKSIRKPKEYSRIPFSVSDYCSRKPFRFPGFRKCLNACSVTRPGFRTDVGYPFEFLTILSDFRPSGNLRVFEERASEIQKRVSKTEILNEGTSFRL